MSDTDSVPSSLDNETELDDSIASSLGSSPYVSDEGMIINSCAKADAFYSSDDLDIVTTGCRWEVKSLQLTQDEQIKILTKSKPADRSNISPDVYIITKSVKEEALKKRIIAFVDGLNGWVYMAPSLMPFLDEEGWHMQTATRLCDACIVTDSQPMRVLTFTVGEDKHGRSLQYSAQLARRIMYHIEENAGLSVSVIHGVIDEDAWKNEELFMTKTKEFEYMAREDSFAQSLRMTFGKYKSITDTLCVMFGAARTEELQTAVLSLPPVKQHIGAEEIESHLETRLTPKKLTDHHLTCVICTEVFTDPATLQCNHTFCKSCLLRYNKTLTEAIQAKSITCPSCRQLTKVATPDSPVEKWISQLKPNHVIQGLMDDFGQGTHGTMVKVCYLCNKQEQETIATQWCSICDAVFCDNCIAIHNMMPKLSDHELVELSNPIKIKGKCRLMCKRHKDKQIEMFCKDCKAAICQMCSSIEHRQCDNIVNLDDMYAIYESMDVVSTDKICTDVPKTKRPLPGRVIFTHNMDKIDMRNIGTFLGEVIVVDDVSDPQCSPDY
ncbi:uncharacterized protein [Haliotis cracherodii]|uniref:uncharacterized protein n=1 Tax=Haliotis cracherodii TaxID=6455 RepID=UPI0039E856C7